MLLADNKHAIDEDDNAQHYSDDFPNQQPKSLLVAILKKAKNKKGQRAT